MNQQEWNEFVKQCRTLTCGEKSKDILQSSLVSAIIKRIPSQKFGLFLSGGVDSSFISLVLNHHKIPFRAYTVGFLEGDMELSNDIIFARKIAKELSLDYHEKIYSLLEAEEIILKTVSILEKPQQIDADYVVKIGVGSVIVACAGIAQEKTFFSGIGSEEIFAGYDRHAKADDINEECWRGLSMMWQRDFSRDGAIGNALGITYLTPFLDEQVIVEAMKFPGPEKIVGDQKKVILRRIAQEYGLSKEIAWRKKQGAQYGSKFDIALEKLAKKYGYKTKGEYLQSL